ncbi:heavy metal translocating P-type ATPase [Blattabacterium cuenoti]|uniref:heavy metal translocating P-type ATPase n=1 Tax=Blattabacterium cuenoti TaxID=1653831 RepID=UPI00163BA3DF|nr:HAD-IC family P-type ATPase [Blattabacterium cuenoti]
MNFSKNNHYNFLDEKNVSEKIIDYKNKNITKTHFFIPDIICSNCILILEKLPEKYNSIIDINVDFTTKIVWITYNNNNLKLSEVAILLDKNGYSPYIDLNSFESLYENKDFIHNNEKYFNRKFLIKLAISFFCFGNIMMLIIPEYIGSYNDYWYINHRYFFRYMILFLGIPTFIISIKDHIKQAWFGIKKNIINTDISIIIGLLIIFFWSIYQILLDLSSGYIDSLSSFSLFLLLSKIFQVYTHNKIFSFNKNYKSLYPLLITKIKDKKENKILLSLLKIGDIFLIKNEEIIPVDSLLIKGKAVLDNSFITGESKLINKNIGEKIYAGSKQKGKFIYLKAINNVNQSYLSNLWKKGKNNNKKNYCYLNSITNNFSKYFVPFILFISVSSGFFWYLKGDINKMIYTIFSILIITCPCALILSSPLIFGNIIKLFSKNGFYIKDIYTMEKISYINTIVFDKTGTLTDINKDEINFIGKKINKNKKKMIASLLRNSFHPLSQKLLSFLSIKNFYHIKEFKEILGKGLECTINNIPIKIGSSKYLGLNINNKNTIVAISINNKFIGYFTFRNFYHKDIKKIFEKLKYNYKLIILSGDNNNVEKKYIKSILPKSSKVLFNQSPIHKLKYIKKLQKNGSKIMMFGDGINDSAALNQSDVGVAISENPSNFFPSCDAFIQFNCLSKIFLFLKISRISSILVMINFIISFFYNIIGIFFSIIGILNPLIASIIMPLSSFSVIIFSIISTFIISKKINL